MNVGRAKPMNYGCHGSVVESAPQTSASISTMVAIARAAGFDNDRDNRRHGNT